VTAEINALDLAVRLRHAAGDSPPRVHRGREHRSHSFCRECWRNIRNSGRGNPSPSRSCSPCCEEYALWQGLEPVGCRCPRRRGGDLHLQDRQGRLRRDCTRHLARRGDQGRSANPATRRPMPAFIYVNCPLGPSKATRSAWMVGTSPAPQGACPSVRMRK
jgi:hypothetical protein